mmetsp:Transcript_41750/g.76168  ORF Transcript_41750/g.76168 Transcript_41750/m.76168 type:complete len:253 (-) Transcript_41750:364-1122(-)
MSLRAVFAACKPSLSASTCRSASSHLAFICKPSVWSLQHRSSQPWRASRARIRSEGARSRLAAASTATLRSSSDCARMLLTRCAAACAVASASFKAKRLLSDISWASEALASHLSSSRRASSRASSCGCASSTRCISSAWQSSSAARSSAQLLKPCEAVSNLSSACCLAPCRRPRFSSSLVICLPNVSSSLPVTHSGCVSPPTSMAARCSELAAPTTSIRSVMAWSCNAELCNSVRSPQALRSIAVAGSSVG